MTRISIIVDWDGAQLRIAEMSLVSGDVDALNEGQPLRDMIVRLEEAMLLERQALGPSCENTD